MLEALVNGTLAKLAAAALDADWLRHRVYEYVSIASAVKERVVQGARLLVLYVAQASEPVEDVSGRIRWRTGGHCTRLTVLNGG